MKDYLPDWLALGIRFTSWSSLNIMRTHNTNHLKITGNLLMKKLLILVLFLALLDVSILSAAEKSKPFTGINHTYAVLLSGKDMQGVRLAAKSVVKDAQTDPRLIELAARKLFGKNTAKDKVTADALAWCARVLETHGTARYNKALAQLLNQDISKKLKKYVLIAQESVAQRPTDQPQFDPNSKPVNLNLDSPVAAKPGSKADKMSLKIGDPIEKVYQQLGHPIDVKVVSRRGGHGWIKIEVSNLEAAFQDFGTIIFVRDDKKGTGWTIRRVLANTSISTELLNSEFGEYISEINSNNPDNIRRIARRIYKEEKYSSEILDHAAERILSEPATSDRQMQDAKAWLCRIIGESGNSRYYSILKEISEGSESKKIRKYAKKALKNISESSVDQYQQGAVNR